MREPKGNWTDLFLAFRMALDLRKMILGFALIATTTAVCIAIVRVSGYRPEPFATGTATLRSALENPLWHGPAFLLGNGMEKARRTCGAYGAAAAYAAGHWLAVPDAIERLSLGARSDLYGRILYVGLWVALLVVLWLLIAFFAGAIARVAAVELARNERVELLAALRYACCKYGTYVWSAISVAAAIVFFSLCNFVAGLLIRHLLIVGVAIVGLVLALLAAQQVAKSTQRTTFGVVGFLVVAAVFAALLYFLRDVSPWRSAGSIVAALVYPFALLNAFLIVLLAIGGTLGLKLMVPAVATEGTDSFDAVSRAFSYVFLRPWRFIFYRLVGCAYALPCVAFVFAVTHFSTWLSTRTVLAGAGEPVASYLLELMTLNGQEWASVTVPTSLKVAAALWLIPVALIGWLMFGYVVAVACTLHTITYFLLRKSLDDTPMNEVYMPGQEAASTAAAPSVQSAGASAGG